MTEIKIDEIDISNLDNSDKEQLGECLTMLEGNGVISTFEMLSKELSITFHD